MPTVKLAFDRSLRRIDPDGRLHVDRSHISKAAVNPYYGKEIPGHEALGLAPDKIYRLFRDPVELERGASTFARLPILSKHKPQSAADLQQDLIVGAIGSNVAFTPPYLDADLCIWDATAIAGIETDTVRELSCGYRYVPVMEPGDFNGEPYDGRMTEIQGNHLALVEVGRAGSDVIVADQNPFNLKESATMKMTKLGKALFAALCMASPALAADSALPALVGPTTRKNFNKAEIKAKVMAIDSELDGTKVDAVLDSFQDVESDPKPVIAPGAVVESPADKLRALLTGKVDDETIAAACALLAPAGADAVPPAPAAKKEDEPGMKKEDVTAAMDGLRKQLREAEDARRDVRPVVGDVLGMDSAAEVYGFALDHMKVDRKDVEGAAALRALFRVASSKSSAQTPVIAADSGGLATKFPNAARFSHA